MLSKDYLEQVNYCENKELVERWIAYMTSTSDDYEAELAKIEAWVEANGCDAEYEYLVMLDT